MTAPTREPEEVGKSAEPLRVVLTRSATHGLVLLLGISALETLVRSLTRAATFPSASSAALELLARTARLLSLLAPVVATDLLLTALGRGTRVGEWLSARALRALSVLTAPSVVLRAFIVYAVSSIVLAKTVGLAYQLRWHAGALFALMALPVHAALELAAAKWRGSVPAQPKVAGGLAWLLGVGVACCLLANAVAAPVLGPVLSFAVMVGVCHGTWRFAAFGPRVLVGLAAAGCLGLWLDSSQAALRRFASVHAPFSSLALEALQEITDLDGDGASGLFGLDCDDLDPTRSPTLVDVPDDGIDQNCSRADGSLERAMKGLGPKSSRGARSSGGGPPRNPSVFLLTVDGLRADTLESGSALPETRAWAEHCYRFTNARSNANSTGSSLISLHTGMSARHVMDGDNWMVALANPKEKVLSTPPTLASVLAAAGYATHVVFPPFHAENFSFLTGYELGGTLPSTGDGSFPPIGVSLERARTSLREVGTQRPLHLRVHLMDLHVPYRGGEGRSGYLRTARSIDAELARFLHELPGDAIVALTADHGEAFGEHGTYTHGHTLFDEEIHVPLVLCIPPSFGLGSPRAVGDLVGLVDVFPTLVDLLGLPLTYPWHGQSLVPLLREGSPLPRPWVFAESWSEGRRTQAILNGCQKWMMDVDAGWEALFDVCADPKETRDLAGHAGSETRRLLGEVVDSELDAFRSWRVGNTTTMGK